MVSTPTLDEIRARVNLVALASQHTRLKEPSRRPAVSRLVPIP
jgi:hypothetical protein